MPDDIRAELIDGQIVYMASPSTIHQDISGELYYVIKNYIKRSYKSENMAEHKEKQIV